MMISKEYKQDCIKFKKYIRNQKYIDRFEESSKLFDRLYYLSFCLYNLLPVKSNKRITIYCNYMKRDLISALNLTYTNNFESAKRDYRTVIETAFRLISYSLKEYIFSVRKANKVYSSSLQLQKLRKILDTHKIGKLTSSLEKNFKNTVLFDDIDFLNEKYSKFSAITHNNDMDAEESNNLLLIKEHSKDESVNFLNEIIVLMDHLIVVIYYSVSLQNKVNLSRQDFYFLVKMLQPEISEEHLTTIADDYSTIVDIDLK